MLYCLRFINLFTLKKTATIYNDMSIMYNMCVSCSFYFYNLKNITSVPLKRDELSVIY